MEARPLLPVQGEDMHAAVARECRAVRTRAGIFDASTLGKIEVVGPDAAEFLNRIYTNAFTRLEPGRCRYGLMLKEDGYIFDDGVVARLARDRFHVTTTTGGAARVLQHMEDYLQTEWPDLQVYLTSITEQYAVIARAGAQGRARSWHRSSTASISAGRRFPHMSVRVGSVCGVPCRLFRVSFTGELGYEINVPSDYGQPVWEAVIERGQAFGITPYGTEAMHVLRAEKGFIIVGQETDGTVTPDDVGLAGLIAKSKTDFVGCRSLARPDLVAPGRKQLVGLMTEDAQGVLEEGAQIVADPAEPIPMRMLGHVTSSYWSPTCGRSIALALIAAGRSLIGRKALRDDAHGVRPSAGLQSRFLRSRRRARPCAEAISSLSRLHAAGRDRFGTGYACAGQCRRDPLARASRALLVAHRPVAPCAGRDGRRLRAGHADQSLRAAAGRTAMRLGPDEWLLSGPQSEAARIAARLSRRRSSRCITRSWTSATPVSRCRCRAREPPT